MQKISSKDLNLSKQEKIVWEKIVEASKNDDWVAVVKGIRKILITKPNSSILWATLANAYWHLPVPDIENAERLFRKSMELDPKWEIASLGLYHVLLHQNRN